MIKKLYKQEDWTATSAIVRHNCVEVKLAIDHRYNFDEHSIHRGRTKGHKFAVTLTDLRHHRVYEIFEGKITAIQEGNLRKLKGRQNVKIVCMDLSSPFRDLVQRLFPYARIVADRFHLIRMVIEEQRNYRRIPQKNEINSTSGLWLSQHS